MVGIWADYKEPIDISMVELTHYKLHKQEQQNIGLSGEENKLKSLSPGGPVARDPEKELLSYVVSEMNSLFEGELSSEDMLNYARTVTGKMAENQKVIEQVENNSQEQAMMGGFSELMTEAIIGSLETHENLATQLLSEEKIAKGFANVVYKMLKDGLSKPYAVNNAYGVDMATEPNRSYGKA